LAPTCIWIPVLLWYLLKGLLFRIGNTTPAETFSFVSGDAG
jgi:hypothetical protein